MADFLILLGKVVLIAGGGAAVLFMTAWAWLLRGMTFQRMDEALAAGVLAAVAWVVSVAWLLS